MASMNCPSCQHELFTAYIPLCLWCRRNAPETVFAELGAKAAPRRVGEAIRLMTQQEMNDPMDRIVKLYQAAGLLSAPPPKPVTTRWHSSIEVVIREKLLLWLKMNDRPGWQRAKSLFEPQREGGAPREWEDRELLVRLVRLMETCVANARARMNEYLREGTSASDVIEHHRAKQRELMDEAFRFLYTSAAARRRARDRCDRENRTIQANDHLSEVSGCVRKHAFRMAHAELQAAILVHQITYIGHADLMYGLRVARHEAVHLVRDLLVGLSPRRTRRGRLPKDLTVARLLVWLRVPLSVKTIRTYTSFPAKNPT